MKKLEEISTNKSLYVIRSISELKGFIEKMWNSRRITSSGTKKQ